jgi:shikimate dehydrogenase
MTSSETKLIAIIGDPVKHSLSPAMQNAAFESLDLDYAYMLLRVPAEALEGAIATVRALKIAGMNVTHPYKIKILPLLDRLDESAKLVGAVNTVKNYRGKLIGYNTDGAGAVRALEIEVGELAGRRVLLLGAGGAARAIAFSLVKEGAELTIANRTSSRAKELKASIKRSLGKNVNTINLNRRELSKTIKNTDIIINATTIGMRPGVNRTLITADLMHRGLIVNDIVYDPLQTRLLTEAKKAGARTVSGLGMLIHQAALSFEIWTGRRAPIKVMTAAAKRELRRLGRA